MVSTERSIALQPQFWQLARQACLIGIGVNTIFFGVFLYLDARILAWVNVISVLMYSWAFSAFGKRQNTLATGLIWTEVVLHAALATLLIGWDSGFHYYLLLFFPALAVTLRGPMALAAMIVQWCFYIGLYLLSYWYRPLRPISDEALLGLNFFNLTVVVALFGFLGFYYVRTIKVANRKLNTLASVDELTQLLNRRQVTALAEAELARSERSQLVASAMLLDVDHFKLINDVYGHEKGDQVLQHLAKIITRELRQHDLVGRWGGEEFMVLLPETDLSLAESIAERLRSAIASHAWETNLGHDLRVTISIGVSESKPNETLTRLIKRADNALYISKDEGRNRVTVLQDLSKESELAKEVSRSQ
ncbi:GGDEF domain-containing protein [Pseudidiomarina insulisalsae]|uniref:diguanylate cyclase n=1 Tax=Pseudidiomarina insulisalsae TaxID=575789 RepID=A0A432YQN7_9GAMM|nr:GGDEF domain-containing protein [Pseudidiomarina insulisalsae]RUO63634.1 GGDEF domain-containing protein [Pseudidiomarina insulisalsae]